MYKGNQRLSSILNAGSPKEISKPVTISLIAVAIQHSFVTYYFLLGPFFHIFLIYLLLVLLRNPAHSFRIILVIRGYFSIAVTYLALLFSIFPVLHSRAHHKYFSNFCNLLIFKCHSPELIQFLSFVLYERILDRIRLLRVKEFSQMNNFDP